MVLSTSEIFYHSMEYTLTFCRAMNIMILESQENLELAPFIIERSYVMNQFKSGNNFSKCNSKGHGSHCCCCRPCRCWWCCCDHDDKDNYGKDDCKDDYGKDDYGKDHCKDHYGKDDYGKDHCKDDYGKDDYGKDHCKDDYGKDDYGKDHCKDDYGKDDNKCKRPCRPHCPCCKPSRPPKPPCPPKHPCPPCECKFDKSNMGWNGDTMNVSDVLKEIFNNKCVIPIDICGTVFIKICDRLFKLCFDLESVEKCPHKDDEK